MVTYRQVSRGMVRTLRAIDRDAKRAERQRFAYEKSAQKLEMLEAAADAADEYLEMLEALTGPHRVNFQRMNWRSLAAEPKPQPAMRSNDEEAKASSSLSSYRPNWFAKSLGLDAGQRAKLANAVVVARARDDDLFKSLQSEIDQRNTEIGFAERVVALEHGTVAEALSRHSALGQLPFSLEGIDVLFADTDRIIAMVDGLDLEDMPTQSVTLLQSGKASIKALPRTKALELHRDNICASAVRVAVEFLQALPIDSVEVVMHSDLLDRGSGHIDGEPVLYLRVTAQALETLILARTEATPLIERLGGHFDWNKREGFRAIDLDAFAIPADREPED